MKNVLYPFTDRPVPGSSRGMRFLPRMALPVLAAMLSAAAPADTVPVAGVWHVTGYEFEAASSPPWSDAQPVSGTATLTAKEPGVTYTLTFDLFGEEESFDLTLQGDRLVASEVEDVGPGHKEYWKMVLKIVDNDTILLSDMFAAVMSWSPRSFDAVGAVLTREPLPAAEPSAWAGDYPVRAFLDFGTDSSEGIAEETGDEFDMVSLVARGGGTYDFLVEGEDEEEFSLTTSGNVLSFEETSTETYFMHEDENWRVDSIQFSDRAYVLQLGGGRIFVVGGGSEVARWTWKHAPSTQNVLDWADVYLGIAGGEDGGDTPAVEYSEWVASLGLEGGDAGPDATPFPDGLPNLVRYAMNLGASPAPGDIPVPGITREDEETYFTLDFRMRKNMTGVTLRAEASGDLGGDWGPVPEERITRLPDADEETARYRVALPLSGGDRRFVRFAAEQAD